MGAITIGPGATNRDNTVTAGTTRIQPGYAAAESGKITSYELWFATDASDVKAGTAYGSGLSWTTRDSETIGSVTAGSKQTFTGLDIDVQTGDMAAAYFSAGTLENSGTGTTKNQFKSGDQFGAGTQTYAESSRYEVSLYATGLSGWANIAKINGIASSSIAKVNGVAVADIAKINGVAV